MLRRILVVEDNEINRKIMRDLLTHDGYTVEEAVDFFDKREKFSLQEFEEEILRRDPEMVKKFKEHKERIEKEQGQKLGDEFDISRKDLSKVRRQVGGVMKLDTGIELRLLPHFEEKAMEKGFDEERGMEFVKIYYHSDLAQQ